MVCQRQEVEKIYGLARDGVVQVVCDIEMGGHARNERMQIVVADILEGVPGVLKAFGMEKHSDHDAHSKCHIKHQGALTKLRTSVLVVAS